MELRRKTSHAAARLAALAVGVVAASDPAMGAIRASSPASSIQLPQSRIPSQLTGNLPFTFATWIRPEALAVEPMHVIHVAGMLDVHLDPVAHAIHVELTGPSTSLDLDLPLQDGGGQLPLDAWTLIVVSWDPGPGTLAGWARSESVATVTDVETDAGFAPSASSGPLTIGNPGAGGVAMSQGWYGLIVLRDHAVDAADFDALWAAGDYFAPYRLDNTESGGSLDGEAGVAWMTQHAIPTNPGRTVNPNGSCALPGDAVNLNNDAVLNADDRDTSLVTAGLPESVTSGADRFVFGSPFDLGSFFTRRVPEMDLPESPTVSRISPALRGLASGTPQGLIRCIVSANSRAVSNADACEQTWPEHYAHGFIAAQTSHVAGVINRPAWVNAGRRWFGFDTLDAPRQSGDVTDITQGGSEENFRRLWTGAGPTEVGAGHGIFLGDGGVYSMKCRPEPGSLLVASAPLVIRCHLLSFPGAGSVIWRPEKAISQGASGTLGAATVVDLDAGTTFEHVLTKDPIITLEDSLILDGDFRTQISAGDACYISAGVGEGGFSVVQSVEGDGVSTTLLFEHCFILPPMAGSTLKFGPWDFVTIEHEWPALGRGDKETWRGLELTAIGGPVVHFSWDAWRPDVDGLVYGVAGWGANGYTPQIDESFAAAIPRWMAALGPDIWLQGFAQQDSAPSAMSDFHGIIRQALPDTEVAWIGDGEHGNGAFDLWHEYILTEAGAAGVVAATVVQDAKIGTYLDQVADGFRQDIAHWSLRGNTRLAERWLEQLSAAALPAGDANGDGIVDVDDLVLVITAWGPCPDPPETCPGDVTGDGEVNVDDLVAVIMGWS